MAVHGIAPRHPPGRKRKEDAAAMEMRTGLISGIVSIDIINQY
jgi:hypothetical protein